MPSYTGSGTIERIGDADWFAVTLSGNQAYTLSSSAAFVTLTLRGPFGESFGSPFAPASGSLSFVPPYSGTFYVEASSLTGTGAYSLTLTSGTWDGIPGNTFTTQTLAVGASFTPPTVAGAIRDPDWYAVDLTGGQSYNATTTSGTIYIADATGKLYEYDGGANAQFSPLGGGRFYVAVDNASAGYTVAINTVTDDYADNITTLGRITPGTNASGSTQVRGDEDWFQANLDASKTYQFITTGVQVSVYDAVECVNQLVGPDVVIADETEPQV